MSGKPIASRDLIVNRRARHDYTLSDTIEAGISLRGSEVKSLRAGKANLLEAFVRIDRRGAWLVGCHISPYTEANQLNHEPMRERQLLVHGHELSRLAKATRDTGVTIVPTRIYLKGSLVKVEIAVAKGKKLHDKRHALKERQAARDLARRI